MSKYEQLVKDIIINIGGKENIISVTHCVTRLRFNLNDESIANDDVLKNMDGVVTVMKTAGQYQVVIGNHVPDVYAEVLKQAGISGDAAASAKKMPFKDRLLDIISGIMMPSIGMLCAAGIIKGFLAMFAAFGLLDTAGSWYILLYAIGDAIFYFFPVVLGFNTAKKFNANPYLGLLIGAVLCYPTINGVDLTFFGQSFNLTYTSSVLPVIFIVALAAPLEKFLMKIIPDVVKTFVVPALVMLIMVPLGFMLIGPLANLIGAGLAAVIFAAYNLSPLIAGFLLGFAWQIIVIFGVHMVVLIPSILNLTAGTPDTIMPLIMVASFAQTGMVFAIWLKTKNQKLKQIAFPAWISGIFGVTEPAIYGVTLPRIKYFIMTCVVSGIGGAIIGLLGAKQYVMAGMGIFAFPGFFSSEEMNSAIVVIVACLAGTVLAAIIGLITYKDEEETEQSPKEALIKKTESVLSPISGDVQELSTIEDAAFSGGLLGQGVAITPKDGNVYAPFSGTVVTLFPTKHAIGIISESGCEVLIHIGMDTIKLDGAHFENFVNQGDKVKQGDKLLSFDIEAITTAGYNVTTPVVVTNTPDYLDVVPVASGSVKSQEELLKVMV